MLKFFSAMGIKTVVRKPSKQQACKETTLATQACLFFVPFVLS